MNEAGVQEHGRDEAPDLPLLNLRRILPPHHLKGLRIRREELSINHAIDAERDDVDRYVHQYYEHRERVALQFWAQIDVHHITQAFVACVFRLVRRILSLPLRRAARRPEHAAEEARVFVVVVHVAAAVADQWVGLIIGLLPPLLLPAHPLLREARHVCLRHL